MTKVFLPPNYPPAMAPNLVSVFMAGSIEMGVAEDWQPAVIGAIEPFSGLGQVYNPRREDWDPSWEQSINNPPFSAQVHWELDLIERADIVFMHFDPATKSPISLMETGVLMSVQERLRPVPQEVVVSCPEGFWRKGNVDIICQRSIDSNFHGYPTVHLFSDPVLAREFLVQRVKVVHKLKSNFFGYFAHETGLESAPDRKFPSELRGLKTPKGFSLEKYLDEKEKMEKQK